MKEENLFFQWEYHGYYQDTRYRGFHERNQETILDDNILQDEETRRIV